MVVCEQRTASELLWPGLCFPLSLPHAAFLLSVTRGAAGLETWFSFCSVPAPLRLYVETEILQAKLKGPV